HSFDVVGPTDVDILLGEDATLDCVITDFAGFVGKWSEVDDADQIFTLLSSGAYIGTGHDSTKHSDWRVDTTGTNHYDLKIPNVDINDKGCYFCGIGTADTNSMSNTCGYLRVIVPPGSVEISGSSPAGIVIVIAYQTTIMTCVAMGARPSAEIDWTTDSTSLSDNEIISDNADNSYLKDTTSTMIFTPNYLDHQNTTLTCEAINSATVAKRQTIIEDVTLDVWEPPDSLYFENYLDNSDVTIVVGVPFLLTCTTTNAHPAANLYWYKDDDVITNDVISRVLWDIDGRQDTISQLSLTAKREDFGKKIKVQN
ncbi:kin of IRRE-like protein 1, partial [Saccoglossus kowalevskii]